ncbi:MAG: cupredoxin domain-containing protein [Actinobacteria bacterium]|nr:cupredoxin domain-containing protein [Actinomycetota bacterium]
MPRKLLPLAFLLVLAAAACAEPPTATVDVGSGVRFLPAVADSLNNAGRHPSVVVNEAGLPVIAYFGFQEELAEGEIAATRPIGAPTIPGVFLATVSEEGYWTRGAMAIAEPITNVNVAFNPAFEPALERLSPDTVTGLAMAADGDNYHAVFGWAGGTWYATGSVDPATPTQVSMTEVSPTPGIGPSIALVDGEPWIAFYSSTSSAATVELAVPDGDGWQVNSIAEASGCDTCRTAIVLAAGGPAIAYSDGGNGVSVATNDGENAWVSFEVGSTTGGQGLSGVAMNDEIALAYYEEPSGQVTIATGSPGSFSSGPAGEVTDGSATADGAGTSIAVDDAGILHVAYSDASAGVLFASGENQEQLLDGSIDTAGAASDGAFPSVTVTEDGSAAYLAWYATEEQDLLVGGYGDLGEISFAAPSPTPTGTATAVPPPADECTLVEGGTVTVVAEGIAFTEGRCIEAAPGESFTIAFDNRDAGVEHNVQIFAGPEPSGDLLLEPDTIVGPAQTEYEAPALDAGEYAYNCVIHPTQMIGEVRVGEGGGATGGTGATGGGGATTTVTASGIAFDTSTIELNAGEPSTITFLNEDADVPHNIAIYPSADDLSNPLLPGEIITGPDEIEYAIDPLEAGEYYFQCDVHPPQMNGTVTVS